MILRANQPACRPSVAFLALVLQSMRAVMRTHNAVRTCASSNTRTDKYSQPYRAPPAPPRLINPCLVWCLAGRPACACACAWDASRFCTLGAPTICDGHWAPGWTGRVCAQGALGSRRRSLVLAARPHSHTTHWSETGSRSGIPCVRCVFARINEGETGRQNVVVCLWDSGHGPLGSSIRGVTTGRVCLPAYLLTCLIPACLHNCRRLGRPK